MRATFCSTQSGAAAAFVVGRWCEAVLTEGILPAPAPDPMFGLISLGVFAESWGNDERWPAVNPGTRCEAYFPPNPGWWKAHADRGKGADVQRGTLRTLWVGAPLQGPVAHGLGCGALMNVTNGALWNAMATHGTGYFLSRVRMRRGQSAVGPRRPGPGYRIAEGEHSGVVRGKARR